MAASTTSAATWSFARSAAPSSSHAVVSMSVTNTSVRMTSDRAGPSHDTTMDYYFYNTNSNQLIEPRPRFHTLITNGLAVTGGDRSYGELLSQLTPGDTLLMYENGIGVVA